MNLSHEKIAGLLKKVDLVREQLAQTCVGKPEPTLRVMDLKYVVEQMYGFDIKMIEAVFTAVYLRGHILRYEGKKATIIVRSGLSPAERRLVAVKELCHLILDEEEDFETDGCNIIDGLMMESLTWNEDGIGLKDPSLPEQSELAALLAAIELVYPREYHDADRSRLAAEETTISAIALQHDMPPYVIAQALKNDAVLDAVRAAMQPPQQAAAE